MEDNCHLNVVGDLKGLGGCCLSLEGALEVVALGVGDGDPDVHPDGDCKEHTGANDSEGRASGPAEDASTGEAIDVS